MIPPAPAAEKMRVAASPAIVIWYEARQSSRRRTFVDVHAAEHAAEQRHVGAEREHVEPDRDDDPVPGGLVEARPSRRRGPTIFGNRM